MRAELEQVQRIEQYLLNKMEAADKVSFEQEMASNPQLAAEVDAQRTVMGGIKRAGLKGAAAGAYTGWILRKWLFRGIITVGIIGVGFAAWYFASPSCQECSGEMFWDDEIVCCNERPCQKCPDVRYVRENAEYDRLGNDSVEVVTDEAAYNWDNCCEEPEIVYLESSEIISEESMVDTLVVSDVEIGQGDYAEHGGLSNIEIDNNGNANQHDPAIYDASDDQNVDEIMAQNNTWNGEVSKEPQFPGGQRALQEYLSTEMKYPQGAVQRKVEGTVYINFTISRSGKIMNVRVAKGADRELNEEAIRVIKNMPDWIPGEDRNGPKDLQYTIPVQFKLREVGQQ